METGCGSDEKNHWRGIDKKRDRRLVRRRKRNEAEKQLASTKGYILNCLRKAQAGESGYGFIDGGWVLLNTFQVAIHRCAASPLQKSKIAVKA
jgi:hypothetical protein